MKRIILGMSVCCLLLATLSGGCATVSGGWNTATVKQAANGDCKTYPVPTNVPNLADFGITWEPGSILIRSSDKERWQRQKRQWPKDGKFLVRVGACQNDGWVMVTLTKQRDAASTSTGETTPEVWVSAEIPPADWNK